MNYLKNIGIAFIYVFSILIISTFLISLCNYIGFIKGKFLTILKIIIPIASLFVGGYIIGKKAKKKGWLEGLKLSGLFIIFLLLFNYFGLGNVPLLKNIIYYLIIMASCITGSMLGINKKANTN